MLWLGSSVTSITCDPQPGGVFSSPSKDVFHAAYEVETEVHVAAVIAWSSIDLVLRSILGEKIVATISASDRVPSRARVHYVDVGATVDLIVTSAARDVVAVAAT
jgi:hypothetical protein